MEFKFRPNPSVELGRNTYLVVAFIVPISLVNPVTRDSASTPQASVSINDLPLSAVFLSFLLLNYIAHISSSS